MKLAYAALLLCAVAPRAQAYSVLTHEAIVDTVWDNSIKPLLLKRFPDATPDQLNEAHGFAYGGCIIQDVGYYPFGNHLFSDLVHYVRTGDFVQALISESKDLKEYAFALGALAHYGADVSGHPIATNRAVPMLYPKLRRKYGNVVTYDQDPAAHIKTEFGFDVLQIARGRYAPKAYHDFIGFQVSKEALDRAFQNTYALALKDVFMSVDLALGTYRFSVSTLIPELTKAAWSLKGKELAKSDPTINRKKFLYNISHASYVKEFGATYEKPGIFARLLAFFFRVLPKVGPFRALGFKAPTPQVEAFFQQSFDTTVDHDRGYYAEVNAGTLKIADVNLDTGRPTQPGEYRLADETYGKLLGKLAAKHFQNVTPELKANILAFYTYMDITPKAKVQAPLEALRALSPSKVSTF
ncbi:MAG: hypothetical protein JWO80_189 [Bryobacterales bacterium]|nr:hypothetical protein [Bryobacterales bacterium]